MQGFLKQSTAVNITALIISSTDHISGKTGLAAGLTIYATKAGGTPAAVTPTVTELDSANTPGLYKLALTGSHTDTLGELQIHISASGADPSDLKWQVSTYLPGEAATLQADQAVNATKWAGGTIPAPNVTGVPLVDDKYLLGTIYSTPTVAGIPNVNAKTWNDLATVALPLVPTTAGRTLDVSATGEAGVDWANVGSPTTTLGLTGTTIATSQVVASVSGAVGSVTGNVGGNVVGSVASVTARVTANTDQFAGQTVTAAAGVTFPTSVASPTNITAGTITTVTNLTNAPTAGDLTATMKTSVTTAATAATPTAAAVTGNVGGNVVGSVGSVTARVTANTDQWAGGTIPSPTVIGVPNVNTKTWNDLTTVALPLAPTTAGRTLDVSATGEAGVDWANVGSPTTAQNLSATFIQGVNSLAAGTDSISTVATSGSTLTTGSAASGTYTSTKEQDSVYWQIADAAGTLDMYFEFDVGSLGVPTTAVWVGGLTTAVDSLKVFAYNWGGSAWEQVGLLSGTSSLVVNEQEYNFTTSHVGTGGNVGKVRLRFQNTGLVSANFYTDRILCSYTNVYSFPSNFSALAIDGSGRVDLGEWLGTAPLALSSQLVQTKAVSVSADAINAAAIADGAIDAATFSAGAINAAAIAADAITDAKVASDVTIASVTGSVGSVTGAVGSVTGNVGGNVTGSVASVVADVGITQTGADKVWASATRTLTSFGTVVADTATAVWGAATRILTAGTNIILAKGVGVTGFNDLDAAGIRTAVGLASANLDTQLDALPTAGENADAVWDEVLSGHLTSGTTGASLNAAGSAGDPWSTALPGSYGAGTAGKILGTNLDATVSSRTKPADTQAAVTLVATTTNVTNDVGITQAGADKAWGTTIEGTRTALQMMRGYAAALLGKGSGLATTTVIYRDTTDSKNRITATVDADGDRSAVTLDLS